MIYCDHQQRPLLAAVDAARNAAAKEVEKLDSLQQYRLPSARGWLKIVGPEQIVSDGDTLCKEEWPDYSRSDGLL